MKTYSYQYASEGRELRRGGGGSRGGGYSGSSGRTTTYSSYNPNAGRVYRGTTSLAYKIEYIPTAFKYEYATSTYSGHGDPCDSWDTECITEYKQHIGLAVGVSVGIGVIILIASVTGGVLGCKAKREKAARDQAAVKAARNLP